MNQILSCNWLPERARSSYLTRSGLPAAFRKKKFPESHIINPLLTKLVRSRWLDIGLVLFFFFAFLWTSTPSRSIKRAKKELGQYPAVLTSHLATNPYIFGLLVNCTTGARSDSTRWSAAHVLVGTSHQKYSEFIYRCSQFG